MPCRSIRCPVCKESKLSVYETAIGGWGYCWGCKFRGTAVELVMAADKISFRGAIAKLRNGGLTALQTATRPEVNAFRINLIERRRRFDAMWVKAQQHLRTHNNPKLKRLQRKLRIDPSRIEHKRWVKGGGAYVGALTAQEVAETYAPNASKSPRVHGEDYTRKVTMFRGAGWGHVLVIPMYDAPQHICGFTFVGRDGRPDDIVYKYLYGSAVSSRSVLGVSMLTAAMSRRYRDDYKNKAFVVPDILLALRMQLRQLEEHSRHLPIVGVHLPVSGPDIAAFWKHLRLSTYVFWCPPGVMSPEALKLAVTMEAHVSQRHEQGMANEDFLNQETPKIFLQRVAATTQPWRDIVETIVAQDPDEGEDFLLRMKLPPAELEALQAVGNDDVVDVVTDMLEITATATQEIKLGRDRIAQSNQGWVHAGTGLVISNAILRIERILYRSRAASRVFEGEIVWNGERIPISVAERDLEKEGAFKWMDNQLAQRGMGPLDYTPSWSNRAIRIAQNFHTPQIINGIEGVGWNDQTGQFLFPAFTLAAESPPAKINLPPVPHMPCREFTAPAALHEQTVAGLAKHDPATKLFWAVTTLVTANTTAPANNAAIFGGLLIGPGARHLGVHVAKLHGCHEFICARASRIPLGHLDEYASEHSWPAVVTHDTKRVEFPPRLQGWLDARPRNILYATDWVSGNVLAIMRDWHTIEMHTAVTSLQLLPRKARMVIPTFLQHAMQTTMEPPRIEGKPTFIERVNHWLADWFEGLGGDRAAVENAMTLLQPAGIEHAKLDRFAEVLCHLYQAGYIEVADEDYRVKGAGIPTLTRRRNGDVHIPAQGINAALARCHAPTLDRGVVEQALQTADVLLTDEEQAPNNPGWLVPGGWWDAQVRTAKAQFRSRGIR